MCYTLQVHPFQSSLRRLSAIGSTCVLAWTGASLCTAATVRTNEIEIEGAPEWVTKQAVERTIRRVEKFLEWDIRKVRATFADSQRIQDQQGLGSGVLAFSLAGSKRIVFGPLTTKERFEEVLGHELTHQVIAQKFKKSIPKWLEEGLANFVGLYRLPGAVGLTSARYARLLAQPEFDVRRLEHPFLNSVVEPSIHYDASTALAEMLQKKCGLLELIQMSMGKSVEAYLSTMCGIKDLNTAYRQWLKEKT